MISFDLILLNSYLCHVYMLFLVGGILPVDLVQEVCDVFGLVPHQLQFDRHSVLGEEEVANHLLGLGLCGDFGFHALQHEVRAGQGLQRVQDRHEVGFVRLGAAQLHPEAEHVA